MPVLKSIASHQSDTESESLNLPQIEQLPERSTSQDEIWMHRALELAQSARNIGEVPVGALLVRNNQVVAEGFNLRESMRDPLAHAEVLAIREGASRLKSWRLLECDLYVTLEPCAMCAGAIVHSRIRRLIFGTHDPKAGAVRSLFNIADDPRLNHRVEVSSGVLAEPCGHILSQFFADIRINRQAKKNQSISLREKK